MIEQLRQKYKDAVRELEFLGGGVGAAEEDTVKALKQNVEEQNRVIEKMQGQINMMLQGLVERDKQHFERKYPGLKALDKTMAK